MSGSVLLDTHAWVWALTGDQRLSSRARDAIEGADSVLVSPITFFEIGQKVRLGKWPEMTLFVDRLPELLVEQGGQAAVLAPSVCLRAALLAWEHRDPFDRIIAATALATGIPLISADEVFDGLKTTPDALMRLW